MGETLRSLEDWWIASDFKPTREELLARAKHKDGDNMPAPFLMTTKGKGAPKVEKGKADPRPSSSRASTRRRRGTIGLVKMTGSFAASGSARPGQVDLRIR